MNMVDFVEETSLLLETLRDAICNEDVNENASHYWVLIDLIGERLQRLRDSLDRGVTVAV